MAVIVPVTHTGRREHAQPVAPTVVSFAGGTKRADNIVFIFLFYPTLMAVFYRWTSGVTQISSVYWSSVRL